MTSDAKPMRFRGDGGAQTAETTHDASSTNPSLSPSTISRNWQLRPPQHVEWTCTPPYHVLGGGEITASLLGPRKAMTYATILPIGYPRGEDDEISVYILEGRRQNESLHLIIKHLPPVKRTFPPTNFQQPSIMSDTQSSSPRTSMSISTSNTTSPLLNVPQESTSASTATDSKEQRRSSTSSPSKSRSISRGRLSIDNGNNTSRRSSTSSNSGKPRKRDVLWNSSLFNDKNLDYHPDGPKVRASSQSVDFTHPEVVKEQMEAMYPSWRK